ncbi:cation:proton antiporter [Streptomyces sp. NPDC056488]|uniref:cation:proton antiporter n=1 Tax=Streptomyces sp. NPDC056488 TaxID=3345836 RepID=UPI0036AE06DD
MSPTDTIFGIALTVALGVSAQILAGRLRLPAIVVLLPVGFGAGILLPVIRADRLFGDSFAPLVHLAVAVILYEAGLRLDLRRLAGEPGRVLVRLVMWGILLAWTAVAALAVPLLDISPGAALMLGAIVVVSGPTVIGPLLDFVNPRAKLRRLLLWEGTVIDPVGAILAAATFRALAHGPHTGVPDIAGRLVLSVALGFAGGVVGAVLLWLLARWPLDPPLARTAELAALVLTAGTCDVLLDDTGLIAATVMGIAVATRRAPKAPPGTAFFQTLTSLIVGVLFISISTTVTPDALGDVLLPTLVLVAVLVVVVRPLIVVLATVRTELDGRERVFIGWMAPRGIVAAATASTFSGDLVARGYTGAAQILPATFLIIVATVLIYGLTAVPVANRLRLSKPSP